MTGADADLIGGENLSDNELYKVLMEGLPEFQSPRRKDVLDCYKLAETLGISYQAIYKWFERGAVPPKRVNTLIGLPGSKLTLKILLPFVLD